MTDDANAASDVVPAKKRKSGVPTGNAGEYFVMGELLRRGYDAQLADRNTAEYDVLAGPRSAKDLQKVQVKTVRAAPWFVRSADFQGERAQRITIYVLLGSEDAKKPVRFFITRNADLAAFVHRPEGWPVSAFMPLKAMLRFEDNWALLGSPGQWEVKTA